MAPPPADEPVSTYWLAFGSREVPLGTQETIIGRGEGCDVIVNEALVSRRHARVALDRGQPYIEDLGSANGTFVNQARLHGRAVLFPGDHIFIGTCEMEVTRRADEDRPTMPVLDLSAHGRHTPASGVVAYQSVMSQRAPSSALRRSTGPETARPEETTTKLDTFENAGRLADKMLSLGRVDAALKLLSGHLELMLALARTGQVPSPPLLDAAGRYAVKLATETLDGRWIDAAVELHLLGVRPFREETIQLVAALRTKAPLGGDALIRRYQEKLRANMGDMAPAERMLCERIACLLPSPDAPE
jgi:hypothetical protein